MHLINWIYHHLHFHIPLEWIVEKMDIGSKGYVVLFVLLFSAGLGVPIPEDIPLLVAGALIATHHMNLAVVAIVAWCGIIGGDLVLYHFGSHFGLEITRVPLIGGHVTKARILKAERLFEKYGVWVVAVGRLFAGIRGAMVIAAGAIRFNRVKFLIADGLAAIVSGGMFLYLGKKFGEHLTDIETRISHYSRSIFLAALGLVLLFIAIQWWKHKRHTTLSDIAIERAAKLRGGHPQRSAPPASSNGTPAAPPATTSDEPPIPGSDEPPTAASHEPPTPASHEPPSDEPQEMAGNMR